VLEFCGRIRGNVCFREFPYRCENDAYTDRFRLRFITSSANNVPRITSLMHRLSRHFTPSLATLPLPGHSSSEAEENEVSEYATYHIFPRPHDLLRQSYDPSKPGETEDRLQQTLRELGFGYRAGFISSSVRTLVLAHGTTEERALLGLADANEAVDFGGVEKFLASLRRNEASWRTELLALKGVGRKVADCIGLMSLDRVSFAIYHLCHLANLGTDSTISYRSIPICSKSPRDILGFQRS
jgi:N-glycosylase/DNA lyase